MALKKLARSCRTPSGWRLATVEEVIANIDSIRSYNLLEEWDRARLLNGWIGGSGYNFNVQEDFRSCLGYMVVTESPTPEISEADDRNAILYYEVPQLSMKGWSTAVLLCTEDWNKDVLLWLIAEDDRATWEGDEAEAASELVSKIAREWQNVLAKNKVLMRTDFPSYSLEASRTKVKELSQALVDGIKKSSKALRIRNKNLLEQREPTNEILKYLLSPVSEIVDDVLARVGLTDDSEIFRDFEPSTWDAVAATVWYVAETVLFLALSKNVYSAVVMRSEQVTKKAMMDGCSNLSSLVYQAYHVLEKTFPAGISKVVEAEADEANGDFNRFSDICLSKLSSNVMSDAFSTFFLWAAKKGKVNRVRGLIDAGVQPSKVFSERGETALHYAAQVSDKSDALKIADILVREDGLVNAVDINKVTPLHSAAFEGNAQMCKLLLHHDASVISKSDSGQIPLHYALRRKRVHEDTVRVLISAEKEFGVEGRDPTLDVKDNNGNTPFDLAIEHDNVNLLAVLLSASSEPQSYFKKLHQPLPLYLREFSRMGYKDLVQKLLDEGVDPSDADDEGKTAVHYAAEGENEDVAWEIIEKLMFDKREGSIIYENASAGDQYGRNVLHVAAFLGRKQLCRSLLRYNINMIDSKDRDGQSAIYYAVAGPHDNPLVLYTLFHSLLHSNNGNAELSDELFSIEQEATGSVLVQDSSQATPLHVAAARGNLKMVKALVSDVSEEKRQNYVGAPDALGQTALHRAAGGGHQQVVELLLASGANPLKERDSDGKTPLHFAAQVDGEDALKIAQILLSHCKSDKEKSLLLHASAAGIGLSSNLLLENYLKEEKGKILKKIDEENLLRVAAKLGDIVMTREFITRGANIALLRDQDWRAKLLSDEETNVQGVLNRIEDIVEQGSDKPALKDYLGRSPFANGLAALFLNPFVSTPITVGISGEWGMGKSSVMVQTESILLKTAAQLAFESSSQKGNFPGVSLSETGKVIRNKIANAIEKLDAKRWARLDTNDDIMKNFRAKETAPENLSWSDKLLNGIRALWKKSAVPENLPKFDKFLKNYQPKHRQIFKSFAMMDRRSMFQFSNVEETGLGNQKASFQGITPSILTVQYNAWNYRNETEAWAGLAVKITQELEATMTVAHKLRTSWIYNWRNRRNDICLKVIFPFTFGAVVAIFLSIIVWLVLGTVHNKDIKILKYGGIPASLFVVTWGLGKSVMSFVKPISSQVVDYICLPDHSQKLGYHQQVIDDINFLKEQLFYKSSLKWEVFAFIWCFITWRWDENNVPGTRIRKMLPAFDNNLRIIVFVDDLDRCDENVILQILSAVNLVLAACEINVILSMEKNMIQRAIIRKYGNSNSKDNKFNEDLADNYLRKIVQLPLHLPDPSDLESSDFVQRQLGVKWSTDRSVKTEKNTTYGQRKTNPKFQIGTSIAGKDKLAREESMKPPVEYRTLYTSDTHTKEPEITEIEEETIEKAGEAATIEIKDAPDIPQSIKGDEQVDLSSIISAMLIPNYTQGEINAFSFLHTRCTRSRKLPREWKCLMAYHRLAWNILSLTSHFGLEYVTPVEGWQVQLIAWIFVCWEWRELITTLIKKWKKLEVLRKWKVTEETSGPSLREIVEHYIDERWPVDKKSSTKKEGNAIDSLTNVEKFEKTSDNSPEENITSTSEEDIKEVLRKVLKEQKEMRDMLKMIIKKDYKWEENKKGEIFLQQGTTAKENQATINNFFREEEDNEGENSLQIYTMFEESRKSEKAKNEEDREEWIKLRETLRRYNVSMDGIQAFQKFRFYCQPRYLPWPLTE